MNRTARILRLHSSSFSLAQWRWRPPLLAAVLLVAWLWCANVAALYLFGQRPYTVDAGGYGDQLLLKGFYAQEENAAGDTYRWTGPASSLQIDGAALTPNVQLQLAIGGTPDGAPRPLPLMLTVNGNEWGPISVAPTPRQYHFLLPAAPDADLSVGFDSPLTRSATDPRPVGLRLDGIALRLGQGVLVPPLWHLLLQTICLGLLAWIVAGIRLNSRWQLGVLGIGALLLGATEAGALPVMSLYLPRVIVVCGALAVLTWVGLPFAARRLAWLRASELRWLWAVTLLACAVRMLAMAYPPFATHDVQTNVQRLDYVARGTLVIVAASAEFASALTIYPPAPYVALLPTYLLTGSRQMAIFLGLALIDGSTTLLIGLLAYRLRLDTFTARMAAALYAGSSLSFTALWWGFTAQTFGQWTTVPLALALLAAVERPNLRVWLGTWVLFQIALLSHAGVAVLAVGWVTLTLGLLLLRGHLGVHWWRSALVCYVLSGLAAVALLYGDVLLLMVGQTQRAGATVSGQLWRGATILFVRGLLAAYSPPGLLLVVGGLALLLRRVPRPGPWALIAAWIATLLLFIVVDLAYALIVRHFYFGLPLACIAAALALSTLARRNPWLRGLAWGLVALYCANGLFLWWQATVEYAKPTMTPLTH